MKIEVLSFAGCPNGKPALELVRRTLRELGLKAEVRFVLVADAAEAEQRRFLGSPTVQVEGRDIEPGRRGDPPSFSCRVYRSPSGAVGMPPRDMLVAALEEARRPGGAAGP